MDIWLNSFLRIFHCLARQCKMQVGYDSFRRDAWFYVWGEPMSLRTCLCEHATARLRSSLFWNKKWAFDNKYKPGEVFLVLDDVVLVPHRLSKLLANCSIRRSIVGDDCCAGENVTSNERIERLLGSVFNSECKHKSAFATLNSTEHPLTCSFLWLATMVLLLRDTSLIYLNVLARPTKLLLVECVTKQSWLCWKMKDLLLTNFATHIEPIGHRVLVQPQLADDMFVVKVVRPHVEKKKRNRQVELGMFKEQPASDCLLGTLFLVVTTDPLNRK